MGSCQTTCLKVQMHNIYIFYNVYFIFCHQKKKHTLLSKFLPMKIFNFSYAHKMFFFPGTCFPRTQAEKKWGNWSRKSKRHKNKVFLGWVVGNETGNKLSAIEQDKIWSDMVSPDMWIVRLGQLGCQNPVSVLIVHTHFSASALSQKILQNIMFPKEVHFNVTEWKNIAHKKRKGQKAHSSQKGKQRLIFNFHGPLFFVGIKLIRTRRP